MFPPFFRASKKGGIQRCGGLLALLILPGGAEAGEAEQAEKFRHEIAPILTEYCFDCHGDGAKKGGVTLDDFASDGALLEKRDLWLAVLKNLRAGLMPPRKKPHPEPEQRQQLEKWIKTGPFQEDAQQADPGRVTIRRLNRIEYRNTIRDLMGTDFNSEVEFPPDDTGHGFDNIGEVLSISPLLLEKYLQAADKIVAAAVPTIAKVSPTEKVFGRDFQGAGEGENGGSMTFYRETTVARTLASKPAGKYRVLIEAEVRGQFDFDPGHCEVSFTVDGQPRLKDEFVWHENRKISWQCDEQWLAGDHQLSFHLRPLAAEDQKVNELNWGIVSVEVVGPLAEETLVQPENYARFFPKGPPPESSEDRRRYAEEILRDFATRAYRRPVDETALGQLVGLAQSVYAEPGKRFEEGIARALMAVLASPRFLFRVERPGRKQPGEKYALVDEYALAARLSYFFWSTMPDAELFQLATRQELRKNLPAQVQRLLADPRSEALVRNFTGQWLQARDVEFVPIDARVILNKPRGQGPRKPGTPRIEFDAELRRAMRSETGQFFSYVLHQDRSVLEMLDSDYTFLNERLAKHYGIPGVDGDEMRRVTLPEGSPRGGLLTQGTVLAVTSNPTRTSPVKRGLFILDNILGAPAPPPPPNVPNLEDAKKAVADHEPTVRELLEIHRADPLCSSCHTRMDPLGLALENFNALGIWRDQENGQPLNTSGELTTGESFQDVRDLKRILKTEHHADFYRCLTEKLLTYALGRGLEYYDVQTVDQIVEQLEAQGGRSSVLLQGIINSAAFQRQRDLSSPPLQKNLTEKNSTAAPARSHAEPSSS